MKLFFLLSMLTVSVGAQFPQWRGPERNGVIADAPALATTWDAGKPPLLWEAKILPREGGEGSPVVADGRVYVFANEPRDIAAPTRTLDARFYQAMQWFDPDKSNVAHLPKIEAKRMAFAAELSDLKPKARKARIAAWTKEAFAKPQLQRFAQRRIAQGEGAVSLDGLRMLRGVRDRTFGNESIFLNWMDDNEVSDEDRENILKALPDTLREAKDMVFCVDMTEGKPLWDTVLPGRPESRIGSSTPTVADRRVFLFGTTHAHCLDAGSGEVVWSTPLPSPASASSPLVTDKVVVGLAGHLVAFDRNSGQIVWENKTMKGRKSSPLVWRNKILVNAESSKAFACVDPADGSVIWSVAGGGDSTPAVAASGEVAVLHIKKGLVAYGLYEDRAETLWDVDFADTRGASSPVVVGDHAIVFPTTGAEAFELLSGKPVWKDGFKSGIISPIVADGKLLYLPNGGQFLSMRSLLDGEELAKVRMKAIRCASPAFSEGKLVVRNRESLVCYDLRVR